MEIAMSLVCTGAYGRFVNAGVIACACMSRGYIVANAGISFWNVGDAQNNRRGNHEE